MDDLFLEIPALIENALRAELKLARPSTTYNGQLKSVTNPQQRYLSPPIASGALYNSINAYWQERPDGDPSLVVEMNRYWQWVDEGRKPSLKMPPYRAIEKWVLTKKGIQNIRDEKGRFLPRKQQVWMIANSIKTYGYGPTNFVQKAITKIETKLIKDIGEAAGQYFRDLVGDTMIIVNL